MSSLSDEDLMAFADGQLENARMREIAALVAADPALAAKVDALRSGTAMLREAFRGQLELEVPERLRAIVQARAPSHVLPFKARRLHLPVWAGMAAAACLIVGFGIGRMNAGSAGLFEMRGDHALVAANELRASLENSASGAGAGDVRIALTFP